jgi:hypothetical protein
MAVTDIIWYGSDVRSCHRERKEHIMSRVYHTGVALTGGRPVARRPIAPLRDDPVDAGSPVTFTPLFVAEGL